MTDWKARCAELADRLDDALTYTVQSDTERSMRQLITRTRAELAQPGPEGPTDEEPTDQEIEEWADAAAEVPLEEMDPEVHGWRRCFKSDEFSETIRAALRRWGRPAPAPSEPEQPEPEHRPVWTEGICGDGAAILRDGVMQPIEDVIAALNATSLAQPELEGLPRNCWLDDEPDLCPSPCVFDDPSEVISNCVYALQVKCKTECKYCRAESAQPEPVGSSAAELLPVEPPNISTTMALQYRTAWREGVEDGWNEARAVLARYARPAIEPVPVGERLPEPGVKVLAHYFNSHGKSRTVCARWIHSAPPAVQNRRH